MTAVGMNEWKTKQRHHGGLASKGQLGRRLLKSTGAMSAVAWSELERRFMLRSREENWRESDLCCWGNDLTGVERRLRESRTKTDLETITVAWARVCSDSVLANAVGRNYWVMIDVESHQQNLLMK